MGIRELYFLIYIYIYQIKNLNIHKLSIRLGFWMFNDYLLSIIIY
jgi:hypothetical protein